MTRADLVRLLREHRLAVVSTVGPDGGPQSAVVGCAISDDLEIVFDTLEDTRKARNLRAEPRCVVTTDSPTEPVVVEGVAETVRDLGAIQELVARMNAKYSSDITVEFMDPDVNATFCVRPRWVFSLNDKEFTASPTRWQF